MPLDFQPLHVSFGEGVDTRTDTKAVISTKLLKAQNVVFHSPGALKTRFGWASAGTYASGRRLCGRGNELMAVTDSQVLPATGQNKLVGGLAGISRKAAIRVLDGVAIATDCAVNGDFQLTVLQYTDGLGATHTRVTVNRVSTGESMQLIDDFCTGTVSLPRCIAVGTVIWVFWLDSGTATVKGSNYDTALNAFSVISTVQANMTGNYDVWPTSSSEFILAAQRNPATQRITVARYNATLTVLATNNIPVVTNSNIAVIATPGEFMYVVYRNNGTGQLEASAMQMPALTGGFAGAVIDAAYPGGGAIPQIAIGRIDATSVRVLYNNITGAIPTTAVQQASVSSVGAVGSIQTYWRRCLNSKPWVNDSRMFILMGFVDGVQGTTYVQELHATVSVAPSIVGIIARGAAGLQMNSSLPHVVSSGDAFETTTLTKQRLVAYRVGTEFSYVNEAVGSDFLTIDHAANTRFCTCELGGLTYIAGGALLWYDGVTVAEVGFLQRPATPAISQAGPGVGVTAGSHQSVIVWEYTDAAGNVHRSAPSAALTVIATGQAMTLTVAPLNMSGRDMPLAGGSPPAQALAVWYYTLVTASDPFYRMNPPNTVAANTVNAEALLTIIGTKSDAQVAANPKLYTAGGVLANYPPPSTDVICTHQNRVVLVSAEDGRVWFSKEYIPGEAPGFNDVLSFALPTSEIPVAMASFDDRLVIFTETQIHVLEGDFPNDQGQGSSLHSQRIASDVGAIDWRSVVVTHLGAFFLSTKGIMLLSRGLQVVFAGADVRYWTDNYAECTAAFVTPDRDEVRFHMRSPIAPVATPSGQTLVLNFRAASEASPYGQWSHFDDDLGDVVSTAVVNGAIYKLVEDGHAYSETTDYSDNGAWITVDVETANIWPYGRQAQARFRTATVLGKEEGGHALELQIAYDDEPGFSESAYWSEADLALLEREEVSHHLEKQKCSGVRLRVTTYEDGSSPNAAVTLSGFVLEVAQRRGSKDRSLPKEARQ